MVTSLEILREHGEPMTLRELSAEFSKRNSVRIQYDDLAGVLSHQEKDGLVKCVAKHKKDWRENKWKATDGS